MAYDASPPRQPLSRTTPEPQVSQEDYEALTEEMQARVISFYALTNFDIEEGPPPTGVVAATKVKHMPLSYPELSQPMRTKGGVNLVHAIYFEDAGEFPDRAAKRREARPATTAFGRSFNKGGGVEGGLSLEGSVGSTESKQCSETPEGDVRTPDLSASLKHDAAEGPLKGAGSKGGSRPPSGAGSKAGGGNVDGGSERRAELEQFVAVEGDRGTGAKAFVKACVDMGHFPLQSAIIQLGGATVCLQGLRLIAKDGIALGAALGTPNVYLREVNVAQNNIGDKGLCGSGGREGLLHGVLGSWGGPGGGVRCLRLTRVNAGHASGRLLGEIFSKGGSLHTLEVSDNRIGCGPCGGGAAEIARGLQVGAALGGRLAVLNLANNRITSAGAVALGQMLAKNTSLEVGTLRHVVLSWQGVTMRLLALLKRPFVQQPARARSWTFFFGICPPCVCM